RHPVFRRRCHFPCTSAFARCLRRRGTFICGSAAGLILKRSGVRRNGKQTGKKQNANDNRRRRFSGMIILARACFRRGWTDSHYLVLLIVLALPPAPWPFHGIVGVMQQNAAGNDSEVEEVVPGAD